MKYCPGGHFNIHVVHYYVLHQDFSGAHLAQSLTFCAVFCRSMFVLFLLAIVFSVLQFTASDYTFSIFKVLLYITILVCIHTSCTLRYLYVHIRLVHYDTCIHTYVLYITILVCTHTSCTLRYWYVHIRLVHYDTYTYVLYITILVYTHTSCTLRYLYVHIRLVHYDTCMYTYVLYITIPVCTHTSCTLRYLYVHIR
jgi:hypothetical protein